MLLPAAPLAAKAAAALALAVAALVLGYYLLAFCRLPAVSDAAPAAAPPAAQRAPLRRRRDAAAAPSAAISPAAAPAVQNPRPLQDPPPAPNPVPPDMRGPDRRVLNQSILTAFLEADCWEEGVDVVPGIGPRSRATLGAVGVHTVLHLLGRFLLLRRPGMTPAEHGDATVCWVAGVGVTGRWNRETLVRALMLKAQVVGLASGYVGGGDDGLR